MRVANYAGVDSGGYDLAKERAAIKKGAALLDRILPGWHRQVNLKGLHMSSGSLCMMGQLFGKKAEGNLAREMYPEEMSDAYAIEGVECGYDAALLAGRDSVIRRLLSKLSWDSNRKFQELKTLSHVCEGHDNKCLWAEAVAERRAKDEQGQDS